MNRVTLKEYEHYPHKVEIEVRLTDLYYQNHVSYDNLVSMTHHVRVKLLEDIGVSEMDLGDGVAGVSVPDLKMVIQGEAVMGDTVVFETRAIEVGESAFRIAHRVRKKDGTPIALMEITIVAFDYQNKKTLLLPPPLRQGLEKIQG